MDNELIEHNWVRILADSCADGVWARGGGAASADDLPVSAALITRIREWQAWYDRDENNWGLFKGDGEGFSHTGLEIARAVKAELPDWTVLYFDEAARSGTLTGRASFSSMKSAEGKDKSRVNMLPSAALSADRVHCYRNSVTVIRG